MPRVSSGTFGKKKEKKTPTKRIFRIRRTEVIAWKYRWGLHHKRAICFWLLLPRCAEGNFTSTVGEWLQSRRTDKQGEGGRQFVKEQQPSRVPSARFMKCSQFQRKVAQEKVGARLRGSWQAVPPHPVVNLS